MSLSGSSSAAAASRNAAAWGWSCWSAVACAVRPYRSRLRSLAGSVRCVDTGAFADNTERKIGREG